MKHLITVASIIIVCLLINGCGFSQIAKVDKISALVNQLELKSTKDDVIKMLGSPDVRKAQIYEDGQLEVLYYKTWIQTSPIGIEYAAAFTPLYFYEGILLMIGDQVRAEYLDPIATMNLFKTNFPSRQRIDVFIYGNR